MSKPNARGRRTERAQGASVPTDGSFAQGRVSRSPPAKSSAVRRSAIICILPERVLRASLAIGNLWRRLRLGPPGAGDRLERLVLES